MLERPWDGNLLRRAAHREQNRLKKIIVFNTTKMKGGGYLKVTLTSDTEIQNLEFVQPIFSCSGSALPYYAPFWTGDVCPVPSYVGSM